MVQILCSVVVAVLLAKGSDETGRVAGEGRGLTVADLSPQVLAALTAAAAEEQVVVDLVVGGWDISGMNLADAMDRAKVLSPSLKMLVRKEMAAMKPLPSIYYPDFIAANQEERADNVLEGTKASMAHVEQIRKDIR